MTTHHPNGTTTMPVKPPSDELDAKAAARMLGTHISTVYRLIMHGKIPARRRGGARYVLRRADVERFIQGEPVAPTPSGPK